MQSLTCHDRQGGIDPRRPSCLDLPNNLVDSVHVGEVIDSLERTQEDPEDRQVEVDQKFC